MKKKNILMALTLLLGILSSPVNATMASIPDDDNPVTEKDKHHGNEGSLSRVHTSLNENTGLFTITFLEDVEDVSVVVYRNLSVVECEEEGDVYAGDNILLNLSSYGGGCFLIVIKSGDMIIYTDPIEL